MEQALAYIAYAVAGVVALAVYSALPKEDRPPRRGLALVLLALAAGFLVMLLGRVLGESGERFYFYVLAVLAVAAGVRVVTHPKPVFSALYFVLVILSTAALAVLAGAEFLGAALVIVYAGAILVTYIFVIMLAQQAGPGVDGRFGGAKDYDRSAREPMAAVLAGFVLVATVAGVIVVQSGSKPGPVSAVAQRAPMGVPEPGVLTAESEPAASEGNTLSLARVLLTDFAVSVELAGVLLMVAMVGAIAIARKRIPTADEGVELPPPGEIGRRVEPF